MNDDAEHIRRQMQNVRQEMGAEVKDIVHGARQLTDWRYHVRTHPWACVAGAFALGFVVSPARKAVAAATNVNLDELLSHFRKHGLDVGAARAGTTTPASMMGRVAAAAAPLVARAVMNVVAQRLAGTSDSAAEPTPTHPQAPPAP